MLKRGESVYVTDGMMLAAYCFDNRYVFVLSTIHGTGNFEVRSRESDNHLLKPIATNEYNKFMG